MKRPAFVLLALLLAAAQSRAGSDPSTIGQVTRNNGLQHDRFIYIKTPSIMRVTKSGPVAPQVLEAIADYDQAAQLSPDPLVRAESLRRAADLRLQLADGGELPEGEVAKAIAGYRSILADYPRYADNDRVLYQLARAEQLSGQAELAIDTLRTLGRDYPASPRSGDAQFRAAELLYARRRYDEAEPLYHAVLAQGSTTPYFEPAQYKYGWSLYQQAKYAEAVPVFLAILERNLPQGAPDDPAQALAAVPAARSAMTEDALRVTGLCFAALGGGKAIQSYGGAGHEPRFAVLLYQSLGRQMLQRQRYSDAAGVYAAFIEAHPAHPLAPRMQSQAIAAYRAGGFVEQLVQAEARYVAAYAPGAPYWGQRQPDAAVLAELRGVLGELGPWYQARAQQDPATDPAARSADFIAAAGWYKKILDIYPQDPKLPEVNLLYADALFDGGHTREAARQYEKTAYGDKPQGQAGSPKAAEAAYAAIQAWQRLGKEVAPPERPGVLRQSVASSVRYADTFSGAPQAAPVLTRAAEDLYEVRDLDGAVALSNRVLAMNPAAPQLRSQSLGVLADSRFAQNRYGESEAAYTQLLLLTPAADPGHKLVVEQLAASIYKQGEAARSAGDLRGAAQTFQRVGQVVPDAGIRAGADYDAASAWFGAQDWRAAQAALEAFRARNPQSPLLVDADKKLALAYQKDARPAEAAEVYARLAQRAVEPDTRREAAWLAASLNDQAQRLPQAVEAYQSYLKAWPLPLDRGVEARQRLAALSANDATRHLYWLRELVAVDRAAGAQRSEASKLAAAQAQLELGRIDAAAARALELKAPLAATLARRKQATETAIASLNDAAAYGYADITTAATYEIGSAYHDLGQALLQSQRPAGLKGADELEQYQLLLEEQADPIEQKAIEAHHANLQRFGQGVWNDWIQKSAGQLAELAPARYGKNEQREDRYEALR
ncbi:MAG: tetratricopeptide repeat protein [Nevskia sp.]|nr:tetratricopeptide repeat protein [Nevskia sp.]